MPMKNPPHTRDFICPEIIEPSGLTVTAAAKVLHVSRPTLSSLLNQRADLPAEKALRVEKTFGVRMETLLAMQTAYNIAQARKHEKTLKVQPFVP